jgi:hypothetical protein
MGKPSEARDHLPMPQRVVRKARKLGFVRPLGEEKRALILIGKILAVFERKIEEGAGDWRYIPVEAAGNRFAGRRQGEGVGPEGGRRTAKHVARKLIDENHEREAAQRTLAPFVELTPEGRAIKGEKPGEDFRVEGRIPREPALLECRRYLREVSSKPEKQQISGARVGARIMVRCAHAGLGGHPRRGLRGEGFPLPQATARPALGQSEQFVMEGNELPGELVSRRVVDHGLRNFVGFTDLHRW